ncbi:MAG: SMP-30/gluconolactonase/LRE family protein [Gemmatimonas sp.]
MKRQPCIDIPRAEFWPAVDSNARHGENPRWDVHTRSVYWIDMPAGILHRHTAEGNVRQSWTLASELSTIVLGEDGRVLVGVGNELQWFDPLRETIERWQVIPHFDTGRCRFNDAAWAPDGSLWLASMSRDATSPLGAMFRVTSSAVDTLASQVIIGNGPAFDRKRQRAYYADTPRREVYVVDLTKRFTPTLFARFGDGEGFPDGMCVDEQGRLWIAHYDGENVSCWSPDGTRVANMRLPGTCPTAIAMVPSNTGEILAAVTTSTLRKMRGGLLFVRVPASIDQA